MRSPGSDARGGRRAAEWGLRVAALGVLAVAAREALRAPAAATRDAAIDGAALAPAARWVAQGAPDSLRVTLDSVPGDSARAALRALRAAGAAVRWRGDSVTPLAVAVSAVAHPRGGTRVGVAAPPGRAVALGDAAGPLDSVRATGRALTVSARGSLTGVTAGLRGTARAAAPALLLVRRVLVLGAAGWEAKFAVAALEEDGWTVDARLAVAPGVVVTQGAPGAPGAPDTARHAAVVALDSLGAADAAAVARYVRSGGGAVLAGAAARTPALAALAPGSAGAPAPGAPGAFPAAAPRRGLALQPVRALRPDATVLEREDRGPVVAARRAGLGRVVQAGYLDSWRWRMEGADDAPAAHRAWWSALVAAAAYAPAARVAASDTLAADPAPYAALVAALGPPAPPLANDGAPGRRPLGGARLFGWPLFLPLVGLLLAEWAARRARGAP
jgi:hypothetical protein